MINQSWTVYEWGTGYSTIWLAQRAGQVITMEHNPEWRDRIKDIAKEENIFNIDFNLYPLNNEKYFTHIHSTGSIDFIIVDGRERVKCFNQAKLLHKPIMLDDSEREKYSEVFNDGYMSIDTLPTDKGQKATIFNA
jgi:hypothetical protein